MRVILKLTLLSLFQDLRIKPMNINLWSFNHLVGFTPSWTLGMAWKKKSNSCLGWGPQLHVPRPAMAVYWELMIELIAGKMWHMWDWTMKLLFWKVHFKIWRNKRNCEILLAPMLFRAATFWGSQLTLPPAKLQKANRWWGWLKVHHDVGVVWCWKNVYDITYQHISCHSCHFKSIKIMSNLISPMAQSIPRAPVARDSLLWRRHGRHRDRLAVPRPLLCHSR